MILGLNISLVGVVNRSILDNAYEFDNRYWNVVSMKWETINDTWEQEI